MRTIDMADWKATRYQMKLVKQVLKSGRLTYGDKTRELEEKFAAIHDRGYALFTSSGTAALKIAIGALKDKYGWKDGDEVLIPAVTFVATMNAVVMNNLKPRLVDIDLSTINMDARELEKSITKRTRAIIPVHLLGQPANMTKIMEIARKHDLKVIEDSCETMFVKDRDGNVVGSQGDISCFSSYIAHLMVTGIGGFICTNDKELATTMRSMMFHGRDDSYLTIDDNDKQGNDFNEMVKKRFHFPRFGYSDRMTEMEAALGLGDLKSWQEMIKQRQENADYLYQHLYDLPIMFPIRDNHKHAFMFFPMITKDRDALVNHLEANKIRTRHMMPLTTQPITQKFIKGDLAKRYPAADTINKYGLLIGCHQYLTRKDLDYVIEKIREFYEGTRNGR